MPLCALSQTSYSFLFYDPFVSSTCGTAVFLPTKVRAERDAALGSEQVLRQELEQCRAMLTQRETECETLRAENSDMVLDDLKQFACVCFRLHECFFVCLLICSFVP